jgi:hypothetical protein
MSNIFILQDLPDESLDAVLSLPITQKTNYFIAMAKTFYPKTPEDSTEFEELVASYVSSFYVEKLYRSNRFFNEKFTPIYTGTGLIRNIIADMYYADDDLITH